MDTRIENSLVLGLVRIFSHYGWTGKGAPSHFQDKIDIIKYGLHHGEAKGYSTHLKMLIQAREQDDAWGLYTPLFVHGISSLLDSYAERNELFDIVAPANKKRFETTKPLSNIFDNAAADALHRLSIHNKTVISYQLIEEYGEDRVLSDLRVHYPKATLHVNYEDHEPDQLRDWIYDDGIEKMTVYYPLMPIVVITNGHK